MGAPAVVYADGDEASGMAHMLGGLLEDNVRDYPSRARVASIARGAVVLCASDRDIAITVSFRGKEVVITNGATDGAPVLSGPWLEMAKLCSGQVSPLKALAQRDLSITPTARLDTVAAAGYVLSIPLSFYGDEAAIAQQQQRRRAIAIGVGVAVVLLYLRHRRSKRTRLR